MKILQLKDVMSKPNPHGVDARSLSDKENAQVAHITLQPGEALKKHITPVDVVFYVLEGRGLVEIGEERAVVEADTLIESPAKRSHQDAVMPLSPDENKALIRRFFDLGPSRGDIRAADGLLADDFTLHVPLPCSSGVQGMNEVISACRAAFEHLDVTVEDMIVQGDSVAARFTARGIHKGAFMGLPATGKSITMTGIEIFRIENGKIAELWGEANLLGLMGQLGIWPPSGGQAEQR